MKNKITTSHLKILLALLIIVRFLFDFWGDWDEGHILPSGFTSFKHKNWGNAINQDDKEIARTAYFYIRDNKFETDVSFDRPQFRRSTIWPSVFRNRYNVLYQVLIIKLYQNFHGPIKVTSTNDLSADYFAFYWAILFFAKWLLRILALFYLYRCAKLFLSDFTALLFLIACTLYPSDFYIFPINSFDTLSVSIFSIAVSQLILLAYRQKINYKEVVFVGLFCCWAFTIKFHIYSVTIPICLFAVIGGIYRKRMTMIYSFSVVLLLHFCTLVPLLVSNKNTIGHATLSTQSSINLFQGHNPAARGSWDSEIWRTHPEILTPLILKEKEKLSADEYTETEVYKKLAIRWVFEHPQKEAILSIKKILIYFTPYNFDCWEFNPFTLLVHLGFLLFTLIMITNPSRYSIKYWLLIIPPWSMVALNVLYFVEYRWRYMVEPEMILATYILIIIVYDKIGRKKQTMPAC